MLSGVPRIPPAVIDRPRLRTRLDGPAPLIVIRGPGGSGKTTLAAQWATRPAPEAHETVVWVTPDGGSQSRAGFWMRVLSQLHVMGLVEHGAFEREMVALADDAGIAVEVLRRTLGARATAVTLVLDNVGSSQPDTFWNAVCGDMVDAVRSLVTVRFIAVGRFPTPLEAPVARASVEVEVIDGEALALTPDETRAIVDHHGAFLDDAGRRAVCALPSAIWPMALRYTLEMLRRSPERARDLGRPGATLPLLDVARQDVLGGVRDPEILDFLGATALSPVVDVDFATRLTGRADAQELLDTLEQSGAGHWSHSEDGTASFRYSEYVRAVAAAEFATRHPERLKRLHARIARWLHDERGEKLAALEHAVQAKDLEYASHVLLRIYPMSDEDRAHVGALLDEIPAHHIHRHPLLALRYALILNAREGTQPRAIEYLISSSTVGRLRASSVPEGERAIRTGIESAVWRLLGHDKRMATRADETVTAMEHALRAEDRDESLEWASLQALHHCGISLMYAGEHARARDAMSLLDEVSRRRQRAAFVNAAHCGLAMIAVLRGEFATATDHLDQIDVAAWPAPWATGYMSSLGYIAQAWVHVNAGRPADALAVLDVLAPHEATIEHWDLMLGARVLAEAMAGRVHEAQFVLESTRSARVSRRTMASTKARLAILEGLVNVAVGTPRANAKAVAGTAAAPLGHSLDAIVAVRNGASADAHAQLAEAESTAASPLDEAFVAVAGAIVATRGSSGLTLERYRARLRVLVSDHHLQWPLAAAPPSVRATIQSEHTTDEDGQWEAALAAVPTIVADVESGSVVIPRLTPREREILRAMTLIENRNDLAAHLFVSINTVKTQLRSLYTKLGVTTRDEAIEKALKHGLLDRPDHPEA